MLQCVTYNMLLIVIGVVEMWITLQNIVFMLSTVVDNFVDNFYFKNC